MTDRLKVLDVHNLPDATRVHQCLHGLHVRGVAKHMCDSEQDSRLRDRRRDPLAISSRHRHGLFQQDVVAQACESTGGSRMHGVLGSHDDKVSEPRPARRVLPADKAVLVRDVVPASHRLSGEPTRVSNAHHLHQLAVLDRVVRIHLPSAASTDNKRSHAAVRLAARRHASGGAPRFLHGRQPVAALARAACATSTTTGLLAATTSSGLHIGVIG
mmetsp:Transcript_19242/g.67952  ORF Transcript_19242/g.67952 Transcript_19242/m.67952 type:complete len:215 (+) Transcript_19242:842-1486(+)